MRIVEHDIDVYVHDEFASADVLMMTVTYDVTSIPGILLHDDLDDLDDDISVIQSHDVDLLLFDDKLNDDDLVLEVLALSSAY